MNLTKEINFLQALGITPGPWLLEESGNHVYSANGGICGLIQRDGNNGNLISYAPDIFLVLFKRCYQNRNNNMCGKDFFYWYRKELGMLYDISNKNWAELCKLWEECAE
jgi:hypothetical protein